MLLGPWGKCALYQSLNEYTGADSGSAYIGLFILIVA